MSDPEVKVIDLVKIKLKFYVKVYLKFLEAKCNSGATLSCNSSYYVLEWTVVLKGY